MSLPHGDAHHDPIMFTQEFWDERYGSAEAIWSGAPNPRLITEAAALTPGNALDVGSGEGADAVWLAGRGWQVTGVDVSAVALERAAAHAAAAGQQVAERITWQRTDVLSWSPEPATYDLVSAQFMQVPPSEREPLHRRLAASVRPGGSLLVVGHHPSDLHTEVARGGHEDLLFTAEQVAAMLDPQDWTIVVSGAPGREVPGADGQPVTIHDAVLHAVRR